MIIVIPMAGRGSRFADQGFKTPKPLINVCGKPMILWALQSIAKVSFSKIIFIALKEHEEQFKISDLFKKNLKQPFEIILIDEVTEGQLCTVLKARNSFEQGGELLIVASDSFIKSEIANHINDREQNVHGIISVIDLPGVQWSFAKTDESGNVTRVAEKVKISDHVSTGMYYFSNGKEFCEEADRIIDNNERTRNEFYVIPVYQKMINKGKRIIISEASEMWDMGTPESKKRFEDYLTING